MTTTGRGPSSGDATFPRGIAELLDELERHGWPARGRRGAHGVVVWPDGGRARQIVIDTSFPLNAHRLDEYRRFTGLPLLGAGNENAPTRVAEHTDGRSEE